MNNMVVLTANSTLVKMVLKYNFIKKYLINADLFPKFSINSSRMCGGKVLWQTLLWHHSGCYTSYQGETIRSPDPVEQWRDQHM